MTEILSPGVVETHKKNKGLLTDEELKADPVLLRAKLKLDTWLQSSDSDEINFLTKGMVKDVVREVRGKSLEDPKSVAVPEVSIDRPMVGDREINPEAYGWAVRRIAVNTRAVESWKQKTKWLPFAKSLHRFLDSRVVETAQIYAVALKATSRRV